MSSGQLSALKDWGQWPQSPVDIALLQWWQNLEPPHPNHLAIAFSGGADSTALLLGLLRLQHVTSTNTASSPAPQSITALHVHHGLQASADDFARHCANVCTSLQQSSALAEHALRYILLQVQIPLNKGDSLEARARDARYRALAHIAQQISADRVLLGQHANDQTESVLLALSRGAGIAGLAGMPTAFERHGMRFARPLLSIEQSVIKDWLHLHQVPWVEDPSNTDLRFTRNRLRHAVLPVLKEHFPGFHASVARSARLAAQADALLQELAQIDLQHTGTPPRIAALQTLSSSRQANALRHWLKSEHGIIGNESQILALLQVIAACKTRGHHIHIKVGDGYVQRHGPVLHWQAECRLHQSQSSN